MSRGTVAGGAGAVVAGGSNRGTVGKREQAHQQTAAAKSSLLNPPCPHDKTVQERGKTRCAHCRKLVELRGREEIEADIETMRERHAEELRALQVELDNLPKRSRGRPPKAEAEDDEVEVGTFEEAPEREPPTRATRRNRPV